MSVNAKTSFLRGAATLGLFGNCLKLVGTLLDICLKLDENWLNTSLKIVLETIGWF